MQNEQFERAVINTERLFYKIGAPVCPMIHLVTHKDESEMYSLPLLNPEQIFLFLRQMAKRADVKSIILINEFYHFAGEKETLDLYLELFDNIKNIPGRKECLAVRYEDVFNNKFQCSWDIISHNPPKLTNKQISNDSSNRHIIQSKLFNWFEK